MLLVYKVACAYYFTTGVRFLEGQDFPPRDNVPTASETHPVGTRALSLEVKRSGREGTH